MQGSIEERIRKKGRDAQGKMRTNLKVYDVRYNYIDPATGILKRAKKRGFLRRTDAEAFLLEINKQQSDGTFLVPKTVLFKEYIVDWLEAYARINVKESTYHEYVRIVRNHLLPYLGGMDIKNINALQLDKLYAHLLQNGRFDGKGGLSERSVLYTHRVLNEALEHAVKKGLLVRNPVKNVMNIPKPRKYIAEIYDVKEFLELLSLAKHTFMELPIALAGLCGLRRGECLGLKEENVDFKGQTILINRQLIDIKGGAKLTDPKTEKSIRRISAPAEVFEIIRRRIKVNEENKKLLKSEYHDEGFVICRANGTPYKPGTFTHDFDDFLKRHNLKKIRFHDLRHSCASLMLKSGIPMKTASEILGHSTIAITADLYTHVLADSKKIAANQLGEFIFGKKEHKE